LDSKISEVILKEEKEQLEVLEAAVLVPLMVKEELLGIVTLSQKPSGGVYSDDDLTLLATLANQVALVIQNIRLQHDMLHAERLATIGFLSSGIAHQVGNALNPIGTFLQLLPAKISQWIEQGKVDDEFMGSFYKTTIESFERISRISKSLLDYAQPRELAFEEQNIHSLVDNCLVLLDYEITNNHVAVKKNYAQELPCVKGDGRQLQEAIINLVNNAIDALSETEEDKREIAITTRAYGNEVEVMIQDHGAGIDQEDIDRVFNPYFTTKAKGKGTGLGLAVVRRIIEGHQGTVRVKSIVGEGSIFFVTLPAVQK
jgi:signal transduction histidine kinase